MSLTLRRDVDCGKLGQLSQGGGNLDQTFHAPHAEQHDVPLRWQPRNNWRPGCPASDDPVLHVQSALEQVERKMKNLKALLGTTPQPDDDGHRVA
jgi:hypothetical protein